jgi:hypothetical protein
MIEDDELDDTYWEPQWKSNRAFNSKVEGGEEVRLGQSSAIPNFRQYQNRQEHRSTHLRDLEESVPRRADGNLDKLRL